MAANERSSADEGRELESPFLDRELFVVATEQESDPRAGALAELSPFQELQVESEAGAGSLFEALHGLTGEDDRQQVSDTTIVPYRWICSVTYERDGKTLDGGTGFLISDRHVLTAGHVITNAGSGPNAPSLFVYPGRHYGGEPFGRHLAAKTRVSPHRHLDFGLITLNRPVDPSVLWWDPADWWTEAALPLQQLRQTALPITTAGYPGVKDAYRRKMFEAQGHTVPTRFAVTFRHTADTTHGQSGSPIWTVRGGRRMLIGIVIGFDPSPNQIGLLVFDGLRRQVARWMAEDAPKRRIPLEVPYRWVCRLEVRDHDLKRTVGYGTGVMISNKHVLTSARVIHGFVKDRRRYSIHITPGHEFGKEALGSTTASKGRVSPRFSPDTKDASEDYGLLTLSRPLGAEVFSSIGKIALGSWRDASHGFVTTDADVTGKAAHVAAFSRLSGGGGGYHKLRVAKRGALRLERGQLVNYASEKLDAPGAPIWVDTGTRKLLAGVATSIFSKDSGANRGCYLSQATRSQLMEWVNADHADKEIEGEAAEAWLSPGGVPEVSEEEADEESEDFRQEEAEDATDLDREDGEVDEIDLPAENAESESMEGLDTLTGEQEETEEQSDFENLFEGQSGSTGTTGKSEVSDTTIAPFRWVCSINFEKADGTTLDGGTGLLISDRHVLTAAHVIRDAPSGFGVPSLFVYPGRQPGRNPFGRLQASTIRVSRARNLDFGLITLREPVDRRLLWWGHPSTQTDWWSERLLPLRQLRQTPLAISTAGFPDALDTSRRKMLEAHGVTVPAVFTGEAFRHTAETTKGQSGSPIWTDVNGRLILIGIASRIDDSPNAIALLVQEAAVRGQLNRWMAEDAPKPKKVKRRIPLEVPYRWVCRLEVRDHDLKRTVGYGTGVMISNKHVLTSARVIHGFVKDRRRYSIHITPGHEFGKEALGSTTASNGRVSPKFSPDTKDPSEDYGLLTLSRALGSQVFSSIGKIALGSWRDASHGFVTTDADVTGNAAHVAAFSRLSGGGGGYHKLRLPKPGALRLQRGQLVNYASEKLDAPGAPIWVDTGTRKLLAGIATPLFSKESGANLGCYLSQATQSQLEEWVKADQADREIPVGELEAAEEEASPESWLEVDEEANEIDEEIVDEIDEELDEETGEPESEEDFLTEALEGDSLDELDTLTSEDQESEEETEDLEEAENEDYEEESDEHEEESDEYEEESDEYEEESDEYEDEGDEYEDSEELEEGEEQDETQDEWESLHEDQLTRASARPAANTVDAAAAEPIFIGNVRAPVAPLLDAATLKSSIDWNTAQHPTSSGIELAELCARLELYIDRSAVEALVRKANVGATSPIGSDKATLVTLLAHQFQRKTCRTPTVGEIVEKRFCTTNGRVAEDTLDALGFVYHSGRDLNEADRSNAAALKILKKLPASAFAGVEPGLTAKTWFSYMVNPPWLGMPIKHGIHLVLLKKLRRAQRALMSLRAYAQPALSPAELGRVLGLEEEHKGARPTKTRVGMHAFGLAIDISYTRNPWLANPERTTTAIPKITLKAARLMSPSRVAGRGLSGRFLHGLAIGHRDTTKIYTILNDWTRWLAEYFALAANAKRLEGLLPTANVIYPRDEWFKKGESLANAAARWSREDVPKDVDAFAKAVGRAESRYGVSHGFMDLPRDLVIALRDDACLCWGAVDFGPRVSGDIMHFDCRVDGIGRTINKKIPTDPHVPVAGHPCLPSAGSPSAKTEFEDDVPKKRAPAPAKCSAPSATTGTWLTPLAVPDTTIPKYKDHKKNVQSTACPIYVADAALKPQTIDLLVFFHGDPGGCSTDCFDPDAPATKKFGLDAQIQASKRAIALAVPRLYWNGDDLSQIGGKWTAARFNQFVVDVLNEIGSQTPQKKRTLGKLIIAGHSRAYNILTPLAREFNQGAEATTKGALNQLAEVWALDSTYGQEHVRALDVWASARDNVRFVAVNYSRGSRSLHWGNYYKGWSPPPNLRGCAVDEGGDTHCIIPTKYVGNLLATTKTSANWCKP